MKRKEIALDISKQIENKALEVTDELKESGRLAPYEDAYLHGRLAALYEVNGLLMRRLISPEPKKKRG